MMRVVEIRIYGICIIQGLYRGLDRACNNGNNVVAAVAAPKIHHPPHENHMTLAGS